MTSSRVWLLPLLLTAVVGVVPNQETIMIAVLLPGDNRRPCSANKVLPSIDIAVDKVLAPGGALLDHQIQIHYADTMCSGADSMNEAIKLYIQHRPHIFMGLCCDYSAAPVGRQTKYWDLPMVSTAFAQDFAIGKRDKYPMMTRVGSSMNKMAEFVAIMLNEFKWKKVKLLYQPKGLDYLLDHMCHVVSESLHFALVEDFKVPYYKFEQAKEILQDMKQEVGTDNAVVFLCASHHSVREIMIQAHELNFDNGEYVFFNIDLFASKDSSERPWYNASDSQERNEKARRGYEALMTVTLRKPTSQKYKDFSEEVKVRAKKMYNYTYEEDEVNGFVGAFHDAVLLYSMAVNETLAANISISNGTEITRRMWNRTFTGITGTVSIDENGDRNVDYSLLDMDPKTSIFRVVANYYGKTKTYEHVPGTRIHWAGGRKDAPPDTPVCGFDGSKCPPEEPFPLYVIVIIVLVVVIIVVLLISFFVYRHIRLEAELAEMNWRVRWEDILFGSPSKNQKLERQGSRLSLNRKGSYHSSCSGDTIATHLNGGNRQLYTKTGYYKGAIVALKSIDTKGLTINKPLLMEIKRSDDQQV